MHLQMGRFPFSPMFAGIFFLFLASPAWATWGEDRSFKLEAQVNLTSPSISILWQPVNPATQISIYRKALDDTAWGTPIATIDGSETQFHDEAIIIGQTYEYRLYQPASTPRYGYVYTGIEAPLVDDRGELLLLVDETKTAALDAELLRLEEDLIGDGWAVQRHDIPSTATVTSVKSLIVDAYTSSPLTIKSLFLVGRIPVPYSGQLAPDGHGNHIGAWPADNFYGDIDGVWTDATVNTTSASRTQNDNIPGDGKYDQSSFPSPVELMVGRIDLSNMPAFSLGETGLLGQYLDKNHAFRQAGTNPPRRALVKEGFNFSEGFDQNGWRLTALVGKSEVAFGAWADLITQPHLFAFGSGGGSYTSAGGLTNTSGYVANTYQAMFTLFLGSYFGDWDSTNNFLRAPLCNPGWGIATMWAGRPNWHLHHMALGEPIGRASRLSTTSTIYTGGYAAGQVHVALMGDPTLRLHYFDPVTTFTLSYNPELLQVGLDWDPSPAAGVTGYHLYRSSNRLGSYQRITAQTMTGTSYVDTVTSPGLMYYMVRPIRLEETTGGSFWNAATGTRREIDLPGAPHFTLTTPASLNYGPVVVGMHADLHVDIYNSAGGDLYFTGLGAEITGPDAANFSLGPLNPDFSPLPAGDTRQLVIPFLPTRLGGHAATLHLYTNDPENTSVTIPLSGEGTWPATIGEWPILDE